MAASAQQHKNMDAVDCPSNRQKTPRGERQLQAGEQTEGNAARSLQRRQQQAAALAGYNVDIAVRTHLHRMPLPLMWAEGKGTKCERGRMEFRNAANRVTCHYGSSIFVLLTFLINS